MGNIVISKLLLLVVLILIYFLFIKSISYFLPFIFGYFISILIEPLVNLFNKKLRIHKGLSVFISLLIFLGTSGLIINFIGSILFSEITKIYNKIPEQSSQLYSYVSNIVDKYETIYFNFSPQLTETITNTLYSIINNLTNYLGKIATGAINFLSAIPNLLLFILFSLLSAFFISKDKDKISSFIYNHIPGNILQNSKLKIIKDDLIFALLGYIKAQLILMTITFTESAIGLTLIGINYSILIALVISIIDALPILGSGSIYIPWILLNIIQKDYNTAIFLGILYLTVTLVRQTLEPKILSTQIGLYPLVTIISIYIGIKLFGFIGIILGPIIVITFIALQKIGLIPSFNVVQNSEDKKYR